MMARFNVRVLIQSISHRVRDITWHLTSWSLDLVIGQNLSLIN